MTAAGAPRPGFRDWALLVISLVFVVTGLLMLGDEPRKALMPLSFFSVCAITFGYNIVRKLRRRRFQATYASVPGGVKLHGSSARMLLLAVGIAVPGGAIFLVPSPLLIRVCGAVMLGAAAWLLFGVITGRFSRRFLRFDPLGLTIGESKYEYVVPWNAIADVREIEVVDNASVGIVVPDAGALLVTPSDRAGAVLAGFANNQAMSGFDIVLMAAHFNVPAESLCAAIRNYSQNPDARAELIAKPALPPSPT